MSMLSYLFNRVSHPLRGHLGFKHFFKHHFSLSRLQVIVKKLHKIISSLNNLEKTSLEIFTTQQLAVIKKQPYEPLKYHSKKPKKKGFNLKSFTSKFKQKHLVR